MKVAVVASNYIKIAKNTKKGTEIWIYRFLEAMKKYGRSQAELTVFASGDSQTPFKLESIGSLSAVEDPEIGQKNQKIFELALVSKAFRQQDKFDLFHIHIGGGEVVLPFASFVKKPILVTPHTTLDEKHHRKYFSLFKNLKNVFFISLSDYQRKPLPDLNYYRTIYHGIETDKYEFASEGGDFIFSAGRGIPEKGTDIALEVAKITKKKARINAIRKKEFLPWLEEIKNKAERLRPQFDIAIYFDRERKEELIPFYQGAKLFLFPLRYEEPFGMVMTEAMSCGTPVVAFARGSVPEVVKNGETGFIVNPSDNEIRGNWVIKKSGVEGLCEAVERIYKMPKKDYLAMRKRCREWVMKRFTIQRMIEEYIGVYKEIIKFQIPNTKF